MKVKVSATDPKIRRRIRALVLRHGLDRRKVYCLGYFGELATADRATGPCSGCSCDCGDGYGCSHGSAGCEECGYTGKRVHYWPSPVLPARAELQIRPLSCHRCERPMAHFDAGCPACAEDIYGHKPNIPAPSAAAQCVGKGGAL